MSKNNAFNKTTAADAVKAPEVNPVKTVAPAETVETKDTAAVKTGKKPGRKPGSKNNAKVKKEPVKTEIRLQLHGNDISLTDLEEKVKAQFVAEGHRAGCIKDLTIYAKPEENKAYYVINDSKFTGNVDLF